MRRAVVAVVLAATLPSVARGQAQPTTPPLQLTDQKLANLALRALKDALAEDRPNGTLLDWYPAAAGGFRVTGGFRDAPEPSRDRIDLRGGFSPYLGFGWQGALLGDSVLIGLDLGAFYRGRPDVRLVDWSGGAEGGDEGRGQRLGARESLLAPSFSLTFTYRF